MFLRRARALEPQNVPPTPPTRPHPKILFFVKLFGSNVSQADKDGAKSRVKELVRNALSLVRTTATLAADAAGDSAVPGLSIGLQALAEVLEKIETMGDTVEGVDELAGRVAELCAMIEQFISRARDHPLPDGMHERITGLVEAWKDIGERAKKIRARGKVARFIGSEKDAKALEGLIAEINASIQDKIMTQGVLNIEVAVEEVNENIAVALQGIDAIHTRVKAIPVLLDASFLATYAKKAQYDAGGMVRRCCLDGTRVELLKQLQNWITAACMNKDLLHTNGLESVWWISGLAGTGKTTIAYSIALWAHQHDLLGGSFFCSRFDPECSNPTLVFLTIARQLCSFHEPFKMQVMAALEKNPTVVNSGAARQFEELIVGPLEVLKALGKPFPPCVLVFDALDECQNEASEGMAATSTIMTVVAKFITRVESSLTFVFTSRPEPTITPLFNRERPGTDTLHGATTSVVLHMIELKLVEGDIRRYLVDGFERVSKMYEVPPEWPLPQHVDKLVTLANGLFIFVTTVIAFLMDQSHRNPPSRLQHLMTIDTSIHPSATILDKLYSEIVTASYAEMSNELAEKLQRVLGTIALAQEPLSVSALASLLGFPEYEIANALSGLQSVLHIPADRLEPILVIHPTFPEFVLRTPERATTTSPLTAHSFYVRPAQHHWFMFSRCLEAMAFLERDMIGIRYPAKFKNEIPNFTKVIQDAVPQYVRYASRYWTVHLCEGLGDPNKTDMSSRLRGFVHEQVLFWLEACILLEIPATRALTAALDACRTLGNAVADLVPLLVDCRRFIQTYSSATHTAPLQLYHFALGIAPIASAFRGLYACELEHSIVVCRGAPPHWSPSLETFVGHGGKGICSVAFSYDGSCFASGGMDNWLRIWDAAARTELQSFDGHTHWVICVAFSPDGAYVVSGSHDQTVCIWQVSSGTRVHTLEGHTGAIYSVAYSVDGRRILSAAQWGEVKLWDTADGRCVFTLRHTGHWMWQVALSQNSDVIARGEGASLVLHDVSSATHEAFHLPDKVEACTFSPDSRYIAVRTLHAIRVWATVDKTLVRSIDMPDIILWGRLAFSRDGKYIACGCHSGAVYVWEVASRSSPHTLNGHTTMVWDVAWSPDGLQLASTADDGTIRLWDGVLHSSAPETSAASVHQPAPPGPPRFAFMQWGGYSTLIHLPSLGINDFPASPRLPRGMPTVTSFTDVVAACDATLECGDELSSSSNTARNWAFLTGQQRTKLDWRPVAISRDGSRLAYRSLTSAKVVDVCNPHTGTVVASLKGHTEDVSSIVFSPDGTRLATGSIVGAVKVWDATTGVPICGHAEHQHWVRSTAFSSNGFFVASGSDDKTVHIFELATERVVHVLSPQHDQVMELMFTVDDEHVVARDDSNQVTIWEVATGARIHSFSFNTHDWPRSLTFSSNTVGIRVHSDAGPRTIGLWKPRAGQGRFHMSGGWVYARCRETVHRLCWIPPEWRTVLDSDGETLRLAEPKSDGHPHGRLIVIDMSRILAYVESLGPDSS